METFYRQCNLVKFEGESTYNQTSWIPEKFAVKGKTLKLKSGQVWDDGWKVMFVSDTRMAERCLPDSHYAIKQHRRNTGDSMKKEKAHA